MSLPQAGESVEADGGGATAGGQSAPGGTESAQPDQGSGIRSAPEPPR